MTNLDLLLVNVDKVLVYLLVGGALIYLFKYRRKKFLDYILAVILAVSGAEVLKSFINKPRPVPHFADLSFEGSSFPSTHTTIAFVTAAFVCHTLSLRGRGLNKKVEFDHVLACIVFVALALFIGYLRIFVGAHYLIDVIGGAILGSVVSLPFRYYDVITKRIK